MKQKIINRLKKTASQNKLSLLARVLDRVQSRHYPQYRPKANAKYFSTKKSLTILACSDNHPLQEQKKWGDYWVKQELTKAFQKLGYKVEQGAPIIIHLFGSPIKLPQNTFNIIWIYSHPDWINPHILKQYDKIFALSPSFAEKIKKWRFKAELMIGAANKRPPDKPKPKLYDIAFVGNIRPVSGGRKIINDLLPTPFNLKIWGKGWRQILPKKYYGGEYIDYYKLNQLYNSTLISLNDHHSDMVKEGFVSARIFDILASGGFCISDKNPGIEPIFGKTVPQYQSAAHLKKIVAFYIHHAKQREKLMIKGRQIAQSHQWLQRAQQFIQCLNYETV